MAAGTDAYLSLLELNPGRFYPPSDRRKISGTRNRQHMRGISEGCSIKVFSTGDVTLKKKPGLPAQGGLWLEGLTMAVGGHNGWVLTGRTWRDRNSLSLLGMKLVGDDFKRICEFVSVFSSRQSKPDGLFWLLQLAGLRLLYSRGVELIQ